MSQNPPQTLSVKRKRNEAPVDALIFEHTVKRQRSQLLDGHPKASPGSKFYFRRLEKPNEKPHAATAPPTPTAERRFHFDKTGSKNGRNVFIEKRAQSEEQGIASSASTPAIITSRPTSPPRKRPGAGSALRSISKPPAAEPKAASHEPSEKDVRALEELSTQIAKQDNLTIPLPPSPSKHKPKAPAQRFAERHPKKAAQLAAEEAATAAADGDAMDIDTDDYVYDTYVRAPLPSTETGPANTTDLGPNIGYLVISSEDTEWWNHSDSSDKEFDTDDEDENAEDYYANDYPEDELSDDDEYDRNLYQKYRHGSDDEEYDLENDDEGALASDENEDDLHFRMTVPKAGKGYWGKAGE